MTVHPIDLEAVSNGGLPSSVYKEQERQRLRAWDVWTSERIFAPLPPVSWLVQDAIPVGSLGMICAYGSSLKSWIVFDLLAAVACGRPWLGLFPVPDPRAGFLVDFEGGDYEVRRRLQAIARGQHPELELEPLSNVSFVTMPPSYLPDEDFVARLEDAAAGCGLVVIDTLAAGSPGVDENDARFALPLNRLKALAVRAGFAVVVLHHTRKPTEGEDERATTRGTSAIFNALDWELKINRSKNDEQSFVCRSDKARGMKAPAPFSVRVSDLSGDAVRVVGEAMTVGAASSANDSAKHQAAHRRIAELVPEMVKAVVESRVPIVGWRGMSAALKVRKIAFSSGDLTPALRLAEESGRLVKGARSRDPWTVGRTLP